VIDLSSIADQVVGFLDEYGMPLGVGLQAAGTIARREAIKRIQREQQQRMEENRLRQKQIQDQITARTMQATQAFAPEGREASRLALAQQYEQYMQPQATVTDFGEYAASNASAPQEVRDAATRTLATSMAKNKDYIKNLASLTSYDGNKQRLGVTLGDAGRDVGNLSRQSAAYSNILPYQLEQANQNQAGLMTASDVLNQGGDAAFMYGVAAKPKAKPKQPVGLRTI